MKSSDFFFVIIFLFNIIFYKITPLHKITVEKSEEPFKINSPKTGLANKIKMQQIKQIKKKK